MYQEGLIQTAITRLFGCTMGFISQDLKSLKAVVRCLVRSVATAVTNMVLASFLVYVFMPTSRRLISDFHWTL